MRRVAALWRLQYGLGGCPSRVFVQYIHSEEWRPGWRKRPGSDTPPYRTGGATALQLYACLPSVGYLRATQGRMVLSPSPRARIGYFWEHRRHEMREPPRRGDGVFRAPLAFFFRLKRLGPSPRGFSTFRGGSAPKYLYTRPQARRHDHSNWCCGGSLAAFRHAESAVAPL